MLSCFTVDFGAEPDLVFPPRSEPVGFHAELSRFWSEPFGLDHEKLIHSAGLNRRRLMKSRGPYRRHSTPFKLQLCQDIRNGVIRRRDAQRTYSVSANLIQLWLTQFDRGELNDEEAEASVIAEYEAHIAALERKVGQLTIAGPG